MPDQPSTDHGALRTAWEFPEYVMYPRSKRWYATVIVIGGLALIYAVATSNPLFALIVIMVGLIMALQRRRQPGRIRFGVTEDGLEVGRDFYAFNDLKQFWIAYKPPEVKKLYIQFKAGLRPMLIISLENENPLRVRKILLEYLAEDTEREDETTTEALARLLKF